jgi:hypothetical protein
MKEESRIEALEHELKILKNEIQTTLLEIREQILNHYYPELRAEEPLRTLSLPVRQQVGRPGAPAKASPRPQERTTSLSEIEAKGQIQPFSDIFLEDLEEDETDEEIDNLVNSRRPAILDDEDDFADDDDSDELDDDAADVTPAIDEGKVRKVVAAPRPNPGATPQTREVNFRQLKEASAGAPKAKPIAVEMGKIELGKVESKTPKTSRPNFGALAVWVNDAVTKVGKTQALEIIETYAKGGKLADESKNSLMQLLAMAGNEEPATPAGTQEMLGLMVGLDQILA